LLGYTPITGSTILHSPDSINRPFKNPSQGKLHCGTILKDINESLQPEAMEMVEKFSAKQHQAQEALILGQYFQKRAYNKGRLTLEFSEGDSVLLNLHSLSLLRNEKGRGRKLLMKHDGPFEVIQKFSPVSYQLWMPASYGIHPIINIAHPEKYQPSPAEFGNFPTKNLNHEDFEALPEYEVNKIITEQRKRSKNGWRIIQYLT
jgi:hypothetical protein